MILTTTDKVVSMIDRGDYTKTDLSVELDISRPTLNTRLKSKNWKKLEIEKIDKLWKKL